MGVPVPFRHRYTRLRKPTVRVPPEIEWNHFSFTLTGRDYLQSWMQACRVAKSTVRLETYIFELDEVGNTVLNELRRAAARGVKVRVLIDAIGSPEFTSEKVRELGEQGIRVRVFGRPRDVVKEAFGQFRKGRFWTAFQILRKFQLRNHRKLAIFDGELALVGSANIGARFSDWRETTVSLRGVGVAGLKQSFIRSWRLAAREKGHDEFQWRSPAIRINFTRSERRATHLFLLTKIRNERKRLFLTTAYFHPRPGLVLALFSALMRGVDVRILSPKQSDISWFPWISRAMYSGLLKKGAKIYEYERGMMHAKTSLFSDCVFVGSTNMNYRSFMHDLELDVVLEMPQAVQACEKMYEVDLQGATLLTPGAIRGYAPFATLISILLSPLKRWL